MFLFWFILGFISAFLLLNISSATKKEKNISLQNIKKKKVQATKIIVFSVMATYYIAFIVAVWAVITKDIEQLSTLLTFVGSVAVFAVAFYCWKSKAENLEKIKQNYPEMEAVLSDFSNMSSQ